MSLYRRIEHFMRAVRHLLEAGGQESLCHKTQFHTSLTKDDIFRGGTFLLEGSFELRNRFADNLGYVLFTDYGNTWNG